MAVISYKELMTMVREEEPSARLAQQVMQRIERRQVVRLRALAVTYGCMFGAAVLGFIDALGYFARSFSSSGVSAYISVMTSDGSSLAGHWTDLMASLVSSWPMLSTTAAIAVALISVYTLRHFVLSFSALSSYHISYS